MCGALSALITCLSLLLPVSASAQTPTLLGTWTVCGDRALGHPWELVLDDAGNAYVTDPSSQRVSVFDPAGGCVTTWTGPLPGTSYFYPQGIAIDRGGHVIVSTMLANGPPQVMLYSFTTGGDYLGPLGAVGEGPGQLDAPSDVAIDGDGNLYVVDANRRRVVVLTATGEFLREWGSAGSGPGQFGIPRAIAVSPSGLVYVADDGNMRVQVFTTGGAFVTEWGSNGLDPGQFHGPYGIALDAAGNVYVAEAENPRIQVFTSAGGFITQWGTAGSGPGQFDKPRGVTVGPDGRVYVMDAWNSRIQIFGAVPTPTHTRSWGQLKVTYR